ncbi:MAG: 16S rRNA (cytosine(967)-C(5))-methyltransferase RsmB [Oscillospiraceae bacterium]|nr:16S rRNA (cytosine(967)-C(5))-methyltransferase RsmB [Oscillospiraceae bacterium]
MTARKTVFEALVALERDGAYSNIIIGRLMNKHNITDKAFASALFYGVLERMLTLDYAVTKYSDINPSKLSVEVLTILRMGIYQLLYMDGTPDYAAVNECVVLCRTIGKKSASGYVNALLRSFIRAGKTIDTAELSETERLSVEYSVPEWLLLSFKEDYGSMVMQKILDAAISVPRTALRINILKSDIDSIKDMIVKSGQTAEESAIGNCLITTGNFTDSKEFYDGCFYVQDVSSQLAAAVCAEYVTGMDGRVTVYDMCAAPGGKSFTIAQYLDKDDRIYSFDLYGHRIKLIQEGADRLGIQNITAQIGNAAKPNPDLSGADLVLCDVPCSGFGVIRRKPEIKYKSRESVSGLPSVQRDILTNSAGYVKQGGVLIYSTCTLIKNENEGVVDWFLANNADFCPLDLPQKIQGIFGGGGHTLTMMPDTIHNDGFFLAAMRKI